jgi:hypothetical protein
MILQDFIASDHPVLAVFGGFAGMVIALYRLKKSPAFTLVSV